LACLSNSLAAFFTIGVLVFGATVSTPGQTAELPDSPGYIMQAAAGFQGNQQLTSSSLSEAQPDPPASVTAVSPIYPGSHPYTHRIVPADLGPQPLTSGQKFELSFRSATSPMSFGTAAFSAGLTHLNNSRPHYGSDRAGFGERLGAAKLKASTESIFSYGLWAAAFHEDPHYYVMGPSHPLMHRVVYSATRVVLTRKDSGGTGFNFAKILGMASSNALTNTYYPDVDREFRACVTAFGTNILTTAATNQINEFLPDLLKVIRHKKH
jgi:hypothetical protein